MKKLFIESRNFTKAVADLLADQAYALFQAQLMSRPDAGEVIPGCGGLRKLRVPDPGRRKGKRGGARVIYLHVPEANWVFLLDLYDKGEKEDLTADEKMTLKKLVETFKKEAIRKTSGTKGRKPHG